MPPISLLEVKRRRFLTTIARIAPQVLKDLRESVFPAFRKLFPVNKITKTQIWQARHFIWEDFEANEDSPFKIHQQFLSVLRDWAGKYSLMEPWILNASLPTMAFWLTLENRSKCSH
ncbi:MAG: hypothetical protein KC643_30870 [Nitrospira sp.]|nr:hypothetical protein [Nitrospira sp.]